MARFGQLANGVEVVAPNVDTNAAERRGLLDRLAHSRLGRVMAVVGMLGSGGAAMADEAKTDLFGEPLKIAANETGGSADNPFGAPAVKNDGTEGLTAALASGAAAHEAAKFILADRAVIDVVGGDMVLGLELRTKVAALLTDYDAGRLPGVSSTTINSLRELAASLAVLERLGELG